MRALQGRQRPQQRHSDVWASPVLTSVEACSDMGRTEGGMCQACSPLLLVFRGTPVRLAMLWATSLCDCMQVWVRAWVVRQGQPLCIRCM